MNKEKQAYKAPSSELLVVRFERNIMSGLLNSSTGTEYLDRCGDEDVDIL